MFRMNTRLPTAVADTRLCGFTCLQQQQQQHAARELESVATSRKQSLVQIDRNPLPLESNKQTPACTREHTFMAAHIHREHHLSPFGEGHALLSAMTHVHGS
jgi:hypothetical protein